MIRTCIVDTRDKIPPADDKICPPPTVIISHPAAIISTSGLSNSVLRLVAVGLSPTPCYNDDNSEDGRPTWRD
jgi:hypothetical protein